MDILADYRDHPSSMSSTCCPLFLRAIAGVLAFVLLGSELRSEANALEGNRGRRYFFDSVGASEGLPEANAVTALQTRDGYLWVGTQAGLLRFDGLRFDTFRVSNTAAFHSNLVTALLEDSSGALWIATERGLIRYVDGEFTRVGDSAVSVTALAEGPEGLIWVGSTDGLYTVRGDDLKRADRPGDLRDEEVAGLLVDGDGVLWIGYFRANGVSRFRSGVFERNGAVPPVDGQVTSMAQTSDKSLWFGTRAQGLYRLRTGKLDHIERGLFIPRVTDLRPSRDGGLWISAGQAQKISNLDTLEVATLPGCPTTNVNAICEDREGNVWLCAAAEGLIRTQSLPYPFIASGDSLPGAGVKTVSEDATGSLWLALQYKGVAEVRADGTTEKFLNSKVLGGRNPTLAYADREGAVWVAIENRLYRYADGGATPVPRLSMIRGIYEDQAGTLWVGAEDGLYRRSGDAFTPFPGPGGRPIRHVTSFAEGKGDALYVGCWSKGIYKISKSSASVIDQGVGLPGDDVRALYVDPDGRLWAGMRAAGIAVLDGNRWRTSSALSDTLGGCVSALADDERGNLWIGGPSGLQWADRSALLAALRGERNLPRIRSLGTADGKHSISVWSGSQPIVWKERNGQMLFATRWGVLSVDPGHIVTNEVPPPVKIGTVLLDQKPLRVASGAAVIPPGASMLSINYTGMSFVRPLQMDFQYMLQGYDRDWVDAGSRRTAYYAHLPAGRFVFRVRASNSDGVWSVTDAQLQIVQEPYFYQTWWFYSLMGLLGIGIAALANVWSHRRLRLRLERLQARNAMERERRRIAKDLHDEIGANLTALGLFAERVRRRSSVRDDADELGQLSQRVRELAESLDTVVWTVNPANDTLDGFASYVCGQFQDLFRLAEIRSRVDLPPSVPACPLDPEKRTHLLLVAREAMTNVIRHAGATEVWLRMRIEGDCFVLEIEDNGCGFDLAEAAESERNGLRNMHSRLADTGGTVVIDSALGEGSKVTLSVRLTRLVAEPFVLTHAETNR